VKYFKEKYGEKDLSVIAIGRVVKNCPHLPAGLMKMTGPAGVVVRAAWAAARISRRS